MTSGLLLIDLTSKMATNSLEVQTLDFRSGGLSDLFFVHKALVKGADEGVLSDSLIELTNWIDCARWLFSAVLRDYFLANLEKDGLHLQVVSQNSKTIGIAVLTRYEWHGEKISALHYLHIVPEFRRKKVASNFIDYLIRNFSSPCVLRCESTPAAKIMAHILRRKGFKLVRNAIVGKGKPAKPNLFELEIPAVKMMRPVKPTFELGSEMMSPGDIIA